MAPHPILFQWYVLSKASFFSFPVGSTSTLLVMTFKHQRQGTLLCQQILLCQLPIANVPDMRQKCTYGNMAESELLLTCLRVANLFVKKH